MLKVDKVDDFRAKIEVKLLNPDDVKQYLRRVGEFASVCYDTDTGIVSPERVAMHCYESGHMSPTRIVYFVFNIKGIGRDCSHQIVRHRIGVEINQRSQRYCDESKPMFVIPESIINNAEALNAYLSCQTVIYETYAKLKSLGIKNDDARLVLSNATATEMNIAFTPQALIHFCHERLCSRASQQIREVASKLVAEVVAVEPRLRTFFVPKCEHYGYCPEAKSSWCGRMPHKSEVLGV